MKVEVKLSPKEIESIILEHFKTKKLNGKSVKFDVNTQYVGYGRREAVFSGAICEVEVI